MPSGTSASSLDAIGQRFAQAAASQVWPTVLLLGLFATVAVFTNSAGRWAADLRFEAYQTPGQMLAASRWIWQQDPALGRLQQGSLNGPLLVLATLRGLGLSIATAQRVWHAALLTTAAAGMVSLVRLFHRDIGVGTFVVGFVYAFNPYSAIYLIPSSLFLVYALAPWFAFFFIQGIRSRRSGRWAAGFAVLIWLAGLSNPPALVYALVPLPVLAYYAVRVDRSATFRRLIAWIGQAAGLTLAVSAPGLVALHYSASGLVGSIHLTESPRSVNIASSWAESIRGAGFWVAYGRTGNLLWLPQAAGYFRSPAIILASFAVPIGALAALTWGKWRARVAFGLVALLGLALMVGSYPIASPSPYGHALQWLYQRFPVTSSFRNSYKAGAALFIGISALAGIGVHELSSALKESTAPWKKAVFPTVLAVASVSSFPFWTGQLYNHQQQIRSVPTYWRQAIQWLNTQPDNGAALVLPGTQSTRYRWGSANDDILDASLRRRHIVRTWLPEGMPEATDLLNELDDRIQDGDYITGSLVPIAGQLGVRYIVIRNDLDWTASHTARPSALDPLRKDPALRRVAVFGTPGQNVVDRKDRSLAVFREVLLPPVEVFSVGTSSQPVTAVADTSPLVVSGNGDAWSELAAEGLLGSGPIRYSADQDPRQLSSVLRSPGSQLVITDTNRRRQRVANGPPDNVSYTMPNAPVPGLHPTHVFSRAGAESIATYDMATRIVASAYGGVLSGPIASMRPANAFDGDPSTAWLAAGLDSHATGNWIRADLASQALVSTVDLLAAPLGAGQRHPDRVSLHFSDGSHVDARLIDGRASVTFTPRRTKSVEVRIDGVTGPGLNPVGFSEIKVGGLSMTESIQMPDDVFRLSRSNAALATALNNTKLSYLFERSNRGNSQPEETQLHRLFTTPDGRSYALSGTLRLTAQTADRLLSRLYSSPVEATGSGTYGGLQNAAMKATDGSLDTGWATYAQPGASLALHFASQPVGQIDIATDTDVNHSTITSLSVQIGSSVFPLVAKSSTACAPSTAQPGGFTCPEPQLRLTFPPITTDQIRIVVTGVTPRAGGYLGPQPVAIDEVAINGKANQPLAWTGKSSCTTGLLTLDGRDVPVQLTGSEVDLLAGHPMHFTACSPILLNAGGHSLDGVRAIPLDNAMLSANAPRPLPQTPTPGVSSRVLSETPTEVRMQIACSGPCAIRTGAGFDPRWDATSDRKHFGSAIPLSAQAGWTFSGTTALVLHLRLRPQRIMDAAWVLSLVALAACALLLLAPRDAE